MDKPRITPKPNGPLFVTGINTLSKSTGVAIAVEENFWLCRCGASANKPFCDGTHNKIGFNSQPTADTTKNKTRDYVGQRITIHDNRFFCSHAAECVHQTPGAFVLGAKPWINPTGEPVDKIVAMIKDCPSGALSYTIDGVHYHDQERAPAITIAKDGPYYVVGGPVLETELPPISPEHYALCRCGLSQNKPYCDGSHRDKFTDPVN